MAADLRFTPMPYSESHRKAWVSGDYAMLTSSGASSYLRRVLPQKAEKRRKHRATDRFFGEAYVSAELRHKSGYYGSFRWLTNPYFLSPPVPAKEPLTDREELHEALWDCFGKARLAALHEKAHRVRELTAEKPAPPDLWLIDEAGNHRFVEVKLPGDSIRLGQLAGLAVIAASLRSRTGAQVAVEVIDLHPNGLEPEKIAAFDRFLKRAG